MIDNIQKLYKLAEIEKVDYIEDMDSDIVDYRTIKIDYPPFTSKKQLELIKWLASEQNDVEISWYSDTGFRVNNFLDSCEHKDFSQALAGLVCELWEDLLDEQKQEIRKILE